MDSSLYDRLGGKEAITAVVTDFCARSVADDRIKAKYVKTDAARLERMLVDQICEATGGPCVYSGRDMRQAHAQMGVTAAEFDAQVEVLVVSLNHFDVPPAEQDELLGLLAPMRGDIVEVESEATGTPLPDAFEPPPAA